MDHGRVVQIYPPVCQYPGLTQSSATIFRKGSTAAISLDNLDQKDGDNMTALLDHYLNTGYKYYRFVNKPLGATTAAKYNENLMFDPQADAVMNIGSDAPIRLVEN